MGSAAASRVEFWAAFVNEQQIKAFAEIGVWRGEFAEQLLRRCPSIERYYMIDPWRHLEQWNKPANVQDGEFDEIYDEAMRRTDFAAARRVVLRSRTQAALAEIPDGTLDAVYIDGDHTLRGITVDLVSAYDKPAPGGFVMGDDFSRTIWQHSEDFEPTFVFPMAVYFAEAKGDPIYGLPFDQFLIAKSGDANGFRFSDLTGRYGDTSLRHQILLGPKRRSGGALGRMMRRLKK